MYWSCKKLWAGKGGSTKSSPKNRQGKLGELIVPFDDFSGVRAIDVSNLPDGTLMNIGFDGVGTKMELAERIGDHSTIAFDLFAMVCDDAVVRGAEPVLIGSILDVNTLGNEKESFIEQIKQLAIGYISAAEAANVAIVNGEVAEIGNRVGGYGSFNYNWGSAIVWFAKKERMFTGNEIKEGDYLVGLAEKGFRSNGLSLVRKIMQNTYGDEWHKEEFEGKSLAKLALEPSTIYSKTVCKMNGGYNNKERVKIHGVSHITGGGIPGKLGRVLKASGFGAQIDSPFMPCKLMLHCQEKGNVSDIEAYKTWNMGQGMIIITPEPKDVIAVAKEDGIEGQVIGRVIKNNKIVIKSKGFFDNGKEIEF